MATGRHQKIMPNLILGNKTVKGKSESCIHSNNVACLGNFESRTICKLIYAACISKRCLSQYHINTIIVAMIVMIVQINKNFFILAIFVIISNLSSYYYNIMCGGVNA